jgi:hypothetical protein
MSIFHTAIVHQQESVFNLIYEMGDGINSLASINITRDNGENMLHLAGKLAPLNRLNIVSGVALQMQWELLWFKVSNNIICFFSSSCIYNGSIVTCQFISCQL